MSISISSQNNRDMFTLTIETGNSAFDGDPAPELARIIALAAGNIAAGVTGAYVHDINGNTVGRWDIA